MSQPSAEPITVIEPITQNEVPWGFKNPKSEAKAAKALGIENPNSAAKTEAAE